MKKFLKIFLITVVISGLFLPVAAHAFINPFSQDSVAGGLMAAVYSIIDLMGNTTLSFAAWLLWACGVIFNYSIVQLVVKMRDQVNNIPAIFSTWSTVRDLANMFFIFILLVIAIQTILQKGDYKIMLRNVILVALFINFSFFFTGVLIDVSNILALQFYNGFAAGTSNGCTDTDGCISQRIVNGLQLTDIYGMEKSNITTTGNQQENIPGLSAETNLGQFIIVVIFGSVLMIVAGGVFLASAVLIVYRFIELIFLLMFSPLAFAAIVLPSAKKYWSKWWDKLTTQLIFAPVYFMFLWVTMAIIAKLGGTFGTFDFQKGINGNGASLSGLAISFIIVISMLIYSLTLAKDLGAAGASIAAKTSKGFQGLVGRNTVGRASSRIANSQAMQNLVKKSPFAGRLVQKSFDAGASASFGGKKGGFEQAEKDLIKDREAQANRMGPSTQMIENAKDAQAAAAEKLRANPNDANAKAELDEANREVDRINGVDKDKATERAKREAPAKQEQIKATQKQINERADKIQRDKGVTFEEAQAEAKARLEAEHEDENKVINAANERRDADIKRRIAKIQEENPGIAKVRRQEYAESIKHDYRKGILGAKLGGAVNLITNRTTKISAAAGIEKNVVKGKSKEAELLEVLQKKLKDDADAAAAGTTPPAPKTPPAPTP